MSSPNLRPLRRLMAALLWLPLAYACSSSDSGDMAAPLKPEIATSNHYINLNIVVSSGSEGTMRVPTADGTGNDGTADKWEDGDEREQGSMRENNVTGITFMLYPVTLKEGSTEYEYNGINESQDTELAFVQYYPVTKANQEDCNYKEGEAVYTTGIQPLKGLDLTQTYRAIVIANRVMTDIFIANTTTVKTVCDATLDWIYTGSGMGVNASNFVMSSENDGDVIKFENPKQNGPTADGETAIIYEPTAIHIERMAARVDFWMNNAEYVEESSYFNLEAQGYQYDVYKKETGTEKSDDKFVLTAVTPFNLYNNSAEEYLLKKLNIGEENYSYLAKETKDNYVVDPLTKDKESTDETTSYNNRLSELVELDKRLRAANEVPTLKTVTGYYQSTKTLHDEKTQWTSLGDGSAENFILCYPKENTLNGNSPLYYYATGVAIEGDYYTKNTDGDYEVEHRVYYGYLRHRGEPMNGESTYKIKAATDLSTDLNNTEDVPMNFGVVRNNIYRISIERITEKKDLELTIRVKKWDTFTHDIIYM